MEIVGQGHIKTFLRVVHLAPLTAKLHPGIPAATDSFFFFFNKLNTKYSSLDDVLQAFLST